MDRVLVIVETAEAESFVMGEGVSSRRLPLSITALAAGLPPSVRESVTGRVLEDSGEALIVCWRPDVLWSPAVVRWWRASAAEVVCVAPDSAALPSWASARRVFRYSGEEELKAILGTVVPGVAAGSRPHAAAREPVTRPIRDVADAAVVALTAEGVPRRDAEDVVADLLEAEADGYASHGVVRLEEYLDKLRRRVLNPTPRLRVVPVGPFRYVLDADQALGTIVRREAARLLGGDEPIRILSVRRAGHLGRLAPLAEEVCSSGRLMLGFVNGAGGGQKVVPFGGTERRLATNPIVFGFPVPGAPPLIVDVSTSTMSDGSVRVASSRRARLPEGVLVDRRGVSVRESWRFSDVGEASLLPLGGNDFGHKGYGLALAVEVIAGVWGGGGFSQPGRFSSGNSALFLAAGLDAMGEGSDLVQENMGRLAAYVTSARSVDDTVPVRLPGGSERRGKRTEKTEISVSLARRLGL